MNALATDTRRTTQPEQEKRGDVLAVVGELLAEGRTDAVLAVIRKLVARNSELERRLADLLSRKPREGVSTAQLLELIDALRAESPSAPGESSEDLLKKDEELREASRIEAKRKEREAAEAAAARKPRKRQPRLRRSAPTTLRRILNPIPVPDSKRACPDCGDPRECIGYEITEVIELIPAELVVRQDRREKLACRPCEGNVERAPAGDKVVAGGRFGSGIVAEILVDKYDSGLPLHRQKLRFARMGLDIPISTLADQVGWAAELLRPIWRAARDEVLRAIVMHLDGTGLPVRDREGSGGIKLGSLWGFVGGETALYLYASTGKKTGQRPDEIGPEDFLADRNGYTVADASNLFDASFKRPGLIEVGCNMHSRRYFVKALDRGDTRAALPIAAFKEIYDIEEEFRERGPEARLAARQTRTRNVYEKLLAWCEGHEPFEPPSSPMGAAIRYTLRHRIALTRFLDDVVIPLDNGAVERLHVRVALTRKNFLFAGSDAGAERAAIAYTVLGSCRLAGVNPVDYLQDILPRLAVKRRLRDAPLLLPVRWKRDRQLSGVTNIDAT